VANVHFKKHLIHQAIVQRTTQTQSSSGELIDAWAAVGTIDCRYVEKAERIASESAGFPMLESHILLCNSGEDVREEDHIATITLKADDSSVDAGPFSIMAVLKRNTGSAHHISLQLERVE
jgi:hypothetical protein